ncbi:MAG: hypothetical protein IPP25_01375 [Saprospiraceae bacterium]|nr:hypothetical protein [Candidatus Opimibacter skivensis]
MVIGAGFILNNEMLSSSSLVLYKIPLALVSFLCLAGLAYGGISAAATGSVGLEDSTRQYENAPSIKASRISEIEEADINENFTRILGFTGGLYPRRGDAPRPHPHPPPPQKKNKKISKRKKPKRCSWFPVVE